MGTPDDTRPTPGQLALGAAATVVAVAVIGVLRSTGPADDARPPGAVTRATPTAQALACPSPGRQVPVGSSWQDQPPSRFTVTDGIYRLSGRLFTPPAPVPLTPSDVTWALLGPGETTPVYDRNRGTLSHQSLVLKVTKAAPAVTHLNAGRYWLVNTYGADLTLQSCDGGAITHVTLPTNAPAPARTSTR